MHQLALSRADPALMQRWRQQVARHWRRRQADGPRPVAAVQVLVTAPVVNNLVNIHYLRWSVVYDELVANDHLKTRYAQYTARISAWGLEVGGAELCRLEKDLTKAPGSRAQGERLVAKDTSTFQHALSLDKFLTKCARWSRLPRRSQLRWPTFWAAFEPEVAATLSAQGPEWERIQRRGLPGTQLAHYAWRLNDWTLYPLSFVSHAWRQIRGVYADLSTAPQRQALSLSEPLADLVGHHEAVSFDLVHSRFAPRS